VKVGKGLGEGWFRVYWTGPRPMTDRIRKLSASDCLMCPKHNFFWDPSTLAHPPEEAENDSAPSTERSIPTAGFPPYSTPAAGVWPPP
jgi:hypothetical protein